MGFIKLRTNIYKNQKSGKAFYKNYNQQMAFLAFFCLKQMKVVLFICFVVTNNKIRTINNELNNM